jgi:hypothetical protein
VAALITYAAFGSQTPFGFLHHLGHPHVTINTDMPDDAHQVALDDAQQEADKAQERADRAQEMKDRAQELSERAKEMAREAVETAKVAVPAIPAVPAAPDSNKVQSDADIVRSDYQRLLASKSDTRTTPTETRTLEPFDSVSIENNADATVTIGDTQSVMITGDVGHTEARVHDGKLTVSGATPGVRVAIVLPHLRALQVNGYGKVSLVGLRDPITIKANGAVELWGSGAVDSAELTMNGPSKFSLGKLEAKNLVVQINGVGDADVNATDNLVANVKGVGHVSYRGSPHLVTTIKGPGSVQRVASSEG